MKVNNRPSFGIKLDSIAVFETTAQRIVSGNGLENPKKVIKALYKGTQKAPGNRGFKGMSEDISKAIFQKYPEIKEYTQKFKNTPKEEMTTLIDEIQEKFGKEIDIVI